jgi:hypothetical protein
MIIVNIFQDGSADPAEGFYHIVVQEDSGEVVYVSPQQHNVVINRISGFGLDRVENTKGPLFPVPVVEGAKAVNKSGVRRRKPMAEETKKKISRQMKKIWENRSNGKQHGIKAA